MNKFTKQLKEKMDLVREKYAHLPFTIYTEIMKKPTKTIPKPTKKPVVTKKSSKKTVNKQQPTYNEFGVCIDCQGGDPNCHHQNLTEINGHITCITCGQQIT